jgi:Flp pilus assembly protein TadD
VLPAIALAIALAAASQAQDTAEEHLGKGYEALRQDRYDAAATEFRVALRLDPTLVMRARFPLAVALFELKQSSGARREFEAVRRETGDHPNVAYYLGRLDLLDQNFSGAVHNLSEAVVKPPFPDTAYYLGLACFKQGDLTAAEKWLQQAAQLNPRDSLARYQLAMVYRKLGREEEAKRAFAESAEMRRRDTDESELRTQCAQKLSTGTRTEARAVCQRLYDPGDAERLTALGTIYGQHGDLEDALEPLRRAAELAPERPEMQYNLAFTYYQMGRYEDARAPIAKAIERWPDIFQLNFLYGAVIEKMGDDMAAYQALGKAHELNPQDTAAADLLYRATLGLARKSKTGRRYPDALRYYGEAAKLRAADAEPHLGMAEVYTLTGHPTEAAAEQRLAAGAR